MNVVSRLLHLLNAGQYEVTDGALEEMDDAGLNVDDLAACLRSGVLQQSWPDGKKHEILGFVRDRRRVRLVARLTEAKKVRAVTVYEA